MRWGFGIGLFLYYVIRFRRTELNTAREIDLEERKVRRI